MSKRSRPPPDLIIPPNSPLLYSTNPKLCTFHYHDNDLDSVYKTGYIHHPETSLELDETSYFHRQTTNPYPDSDPFVYETNYFQTILNHLKRVIS